MREVPLGELLEVLIDHRGKTPKKMGGDFTSDGVPVLSAFNIKDGRIDWSQRMRRLPPEMYRRWMPVPLREGDVLLTSEGGSLGQVVQVPNDDPVVLGQRLFALRGRADVIDNGYLAQALRWDVLQQRIYARSTGSAVVGIRQSELLRIPVPVRALSEQRAIAEILAALETKTELNISLIPLMRDLACTELQAAALDRELQVTADVATVRRGLSYTGDGLADAGMPMVNLANAANYGWLKRDGFKYYRGPHKPRHVANPGSLLIPSVEQTWRAEILGWPVLLPDDVGPALFSHHMLLVEFNRDNEWMKLPLWAHLYSSDARARIEGMAYGTTVATIPQEAITGLSFPVPDRDATAIALAEDLLWRAWAAEVETQRLRALRNVLLPALMSGEIQPRDAEVVAAEAV